MNSYKQTCGTITYNVQDFDNMVEVFEHIEQTPEIENYQLAKSSYLKSRSYFYETDDFDKVKFNLKYGKQKETSRYIDQLKISTTQETEISTAYKMDIEGVAYDMGAVISGEPECCINTGNPECKPHMKIFIDCGYYCGVEAKIIANRGIAVYQLINNLLSLGYILDIYIVHYITAWDDTYYAQRIKLSTDYLALSQLAYAGTCEFFRVVTWLLTAIQKKRKDYTGDGKSMPVKEAIEQMKKEGLYIPSGYTDARFNDCDAKKAKELVTEIYNEYLEEKCK